MLKLILFLSHRSIQDWVKENSSTFSGNEAKSEIDSYTREDFGSDFKKHQEAMRKDEL